jgi:hypothetical protein
MWLPLSQLNIPNLDWTTSLRIWVYTSEHTISGSNAAGRSGFVMGIDNNPGGNPLDFNAINTWWGKVVFRSGNTATTPAGAARLLQGSAGTSTAWSAMTSFTTWSGAISTTVIETGEIGAGEPLGGRPYWYTAQPYSGGWQNRAPWGVNKSDAVDGSGSGGGVGNATSQSSPAAPGDAMGIVLAHWNINASTANDRVVVARLRVDYKL